MRTVATNGWGFSTTTGTGLFTAIAHRYDPTAPNEFGGRGAFTAQRALDLSTYKVAHGADAARRLARRWALANGFIRVYRRPASFHRFRRRLAKTAETGD